MRSLFELNPFASRPRALLVLLAVLYGALNAFKALQIDDAAYFYFARQLARAPLNPYGFELLWYQVPNQANDILAPPVLPYSWALALKVVGDSPTLCKLFLLPWSLLLLFNLHALFRRFAQGWEMPLTVFTAFSPALWPSLNLMLDIPALGLTLCAIHLFLRACDEDDGKRAVLAGLVAGLAIQTKYTGLVAPGVMLLGGVLLGRWRLIPAALLTTAQVFISWELLMALCYDRSHFFNNLPAQPLGEADGGVLARLAALVDEKTVLIPLLFTLVGSVAPALIVLEAAALGMRWRGLLIVSLLLFLGMASIAGDYAGYTDWLHEYIQAVFNFFGVPWVVVISDAVCFLLGLLALLLAGGIAVRLLLLRDQPGSSAPARNAGRLTIFLLLWLGMETGGFFMMTPFPAVRRVLGLTVVLTLLTGRLAAQMCWTPRRRCTLRVILAGGVVLGFAYFALDFWNAKVQQLAADEAADWIEAHGGGRVWYVGHWGFQYYAEHRSMEPVYVPYPPNASRRLRVGDWLVVPDERHDQQEIFLDSRKLRKQYFVNEEDWIPLRTVPNYYGGTTALQHHEGPRFQLQIYQVVAEFDPVAKPRPPP